MTGAVARDFRDEVLAANLALPRHGLVVGTSGNASARDPETGLVVIKPSGVPYESMTPDDLVVLDLDGSVVEGRLSPSADTATHLYLYRRRADVGAVIHTHSTYATGWAANGESIPVYLTSIADNFGGPVPCGGYAVIGGEEIGAEVLRVCGRSPAVLLKNHGVFCLAADLDKTLHAAVMVEQVAHAAFVARALGNPSEIPADEVARQHAFHTEHYGQRDDVATRRPGAAR
jgi:L-ribulose-5-phosphate 4-epimerase